MRRREFITLIGGAAVAWPLVARAQQPAMPLVGFMSARSPGDSAHLVAAFRRGMGEGGFVEGQNVAVEYRWANGEYDRMPALAADLVNRRVAVLVATGGDVSALAAKRATSTIPIVFGSGSDPVAIGMVASINRPGGNVTGVNVLTNQMEPKRLGLLHELVPGVPLIGVLMNQNFPPAARQLLDLEEASRTIGQRLFVAKASNDTELDAAFTALAQQQVRALLVAADPYFDTRRERIVAFAAQHRLPAMYQFREYAAAGGLVSYGVSLSEAYRLEGAYTAKILKGEKPSDLPVQLLVKTELVINLKAAKALGFEFPATFSARADEVIE
jgi:putative tryptophan/tyrosine transport system substrate-binding protein